MYTPLRLKPQAQRLMKSTSIMGKAGLDIKDLPQLLNPEYALKNINYIMTTDGGLSKRGGLLKMIEDAGVEGITILKPFTDDIWIYGFGTTLKAYTFSTNTKTVIKNNFVQAGFSGEKYGNYFFVASPGDKIGYFDNTTLTFTSIAGAPKATVLKVIGARLFAGNLDTDVSAVAYCKLDDGSDPPFQDWTVGTDLTDPGLVSYRAGGTVLSIESLGQNVIVFQDGGYYSFVIDSTTVGSVLQKIDTFVIQRKDKGGSRGTLLTAKGLFYLSPTGLWQLMSIGQPNIMFSEQEGLSSMLLGGKYFKDIDLTNADMTYNARIDTLFITCAKGSVKNNFVISFNVATKAFSEFTGWKINRFMHIDDDHIYGAGSYENKIYKCFDGFSDDGQDIPTDFYQELKTADLETRSELIGGYIQGLLSAGTSLRVAFDIFDVAGQLVIDKRVFTFTPQNASSQNNGFNSQHFNSAFGGDASPQGLIECFDGFGPNGRISNYQRIRIHITGSDEQYHQLNWIRLVTRPKASIRRRKLLKIK